MAGLRGNQRMYFIIQALKTALPSVIVQGIHTGIVYCSVVSCVLCICVVLSAYYDMYILVLAYVIYMYMLHFVYMIYMYKYVMCSIKLMYACKLTYPHTLIYTPLFIRSIPRGDQQGAR